MGLDHRTPVDAAQVLVASWFTIHISNIPTATAFESTLG